MFENLSYLQPEKLQPFGSTNPRDYYTIGQECYVILEGMDYYLVLNRRYEPLGKLSLVDGLSVMESAEFKNTHVKDSDWEDYEWPKGNSWLIARWYSVEDAKYSKE